jgi:hypothetical protein
MIHISISKEHFNREELLILACKLNQDFNLGVATVVRIFDNRDSAKKYTSPWEPEKPAGWMQHEKALRAYYIRDFAKGDHWLSWYSDPDKKKETFLHLSIPEGNPTVQRCQTARVSSSPEGAMDGCTGDVAVAFAQEGGAQIGWAFCFELGGKGKLYMPPLALDFLSLKRDPNGRVEFRTEAEPGGEFYFLVTGTVVGEGMSGVLEYVSVQQGTASRRYSIQGYVMGKNIRQDRWSGLYSNLRYVEETGDLVGVSFMYFDDLQRPVGLICFYEGQGGPILGFDKVERINDHQIRFRTQSFTGVENYTAVFSADSVTISRNDITPPLSIPSVVLPRQHNAF